MWRIILQQLLAVATCRPPHHAICCLDPATTSQKVTAVATTHTTAPGCYSLQTSTACYLMPGSCLQLHKIYLLLLQPHTQQLLAVTACKPLHHAILCLDPATTSQNITAVVATTHNSSWLLQPADLSNPWYPLPGSYYNYNCCCCNHTHNEYNVQNFMKHSVRKQIVYVQ